jgi:ppGpp synthetase/RelA/SpoT-type nucleotidyltranferase
MAERTVKDRLRDEYFHLLPDIRRVVDQLEAEVRLCLLPISRSLAKHEKVVVTSRVKDCESAIESLRRHQPHRTFDPSRDYSLNELPDLAGVRVLAFPRRRLAENRSRVAKTVSRLAVGPCPVG